MSGPGARGPASALCAACGHRAVTHLHAPPCPGAADPLGFDVPRAMRQWTYQQGYPLLTVSVDDKRRVWLHQAPFGLQGAAPCDPSTAWWLPISYVTSDSPGKLRWTQLNECQSSTHLLTLK